MYIPQPAKCSGLMGSATVILSVRTVGQSEVEVSVHDGGGAEAEIGPTSRVCSGLDASHGPSAWTGRERSRSQTPLLAFSNSGVTF